jgi:hypothetical protein
MRPSKRAEADFGDRPTDSRFHEVAVVIADTNLNHSVRIQDGIFSISRSKLRDGDAASCDGLMFDHKYFRRPLAIADGGRQPLQRHLAMVDGDQQPLRQSLEITDGVKREA